MTHTKKILLASVGAVALALGSNAFAAGTTTISISGTVSATCAFVTTGYVMPFGALDPSSTTPATQTTLISYQCTNGTAASSVKINGVASPTSVNIVNGASNLPVSLTWTVPATTGTGFGAAAPITFNVNGSIAVADLNTAISGAYTGSFSVALLP